MPTFKLLLAIYGTVYRYVLSISYLIDIFMNFFLLQNTKEVNLKNVGNQTLTSLLVH